MTEQRIADRIEWRDAMARMAILERRADPARYRYTPRPLMRVEVAEQQPAEEPAAEVAA